MNGALEVAIEEMLSLPKLTKRVSCFLPSSFLCPVQGTVCITRLLQKSPLIDAVKGLFHTPALSLSIA